MREENLTLVEAQNPDSWLCRLLRLDSLGQPWLESLSQADWMGVVRSSIWHSLAPILYKRLKTQSYSDHIPKEALRDLRECYLQCLSRGILRMHTLSQLLRAFQDEGIPVIPLKGAYLAEAIYGDPALRPMSDLDLLFRKPDLPRVVDKLTSMEYQPARKFWIEYQCSVSHELPPFHKAGSPPISAHWTLILPALNYNIDLDSLWRRANLCSIFEMKIHSLAPEDLLLHLCMHAATQHLLRSGLRMTYDVAVTLKHFQDEIDWEALSTRAEQWNASRVTYLMFFLAKQLFGAPTPHGFLEKLRPGNFNPEIVEVASNLIFIGRQDFSTFSPELAALLKAKGALARGRLILCRIFPPPIEMARLYPVMPDSPKIILYYPVRVKDVLFKHLRSGLKLISGEQSTVDSARLALMRTEQEDWLVKSLT